MYVLFIFWAELPPYSSRTTQKAFCCPPSNIKVRYLELTSFSFLDVRRIMIFIITILLLAADFYYLKNIAGRRLVGLRWWNEVDPATGDSKWVFESSEPGTKIINATDSRFFWLALYVQPLLWILMAFLAIVRLSFLWLPLVSKSKQPLPLFY